MLIFIGTNVVACSSSVFPLDFSEFLEVLQVDCEELMSLAHISPFTISCSIIFSERTMKNEKKSILRRLTTDPSLST